MSYNTTEKPIWNCTNEYLSKKKGSLTNSIKEIKQATNQPNK